MVCYLLIEREQLKLTGYSVTLSVIIGRVLLTVVVLSYRSRSISVHREFRILLMSAARQVLASSVFVYIDGLCIVWIL